MHRRLALSASIAAALSVLVGLGCSPSTDSKPQAASTRGLADVWADVLTQRDAIHLVFTKDLEEVTHADCAAVGSAARRIDELFSELVNVLGAKSGQADGRLRSLGEAITRSVKVTSKVRETALAEAPGAWPPLRFPLDQSLAEVESYFNAGDLRGESVRSRPGFEVKKLPAPLSPI